MVKQKRVFCGILCIFVLEVVALAGFGFCRTDFSQDVVAVNEIVQTVKNDWGNMKNHVNQTDVDYVVLDEAENIIYRTADGLSESIHAAVLHRDTILNIESTGQSLGSILIYNDTQERFQEQKQAVVRILSAAVLFQCMLCAAYIWYLNRNIVKPFCKLKGFAERIAQGNLDIPLEMDRYNLFGAFTEGFDIMRSELKRARIAEAKANAGKKELIARLSHDIKTPVASIKAASEVGFALAGDKRLQDNYTQIIQKADQINTLITNLFTAALEELQHLSVTPVELESREVEILLQNADYLHRAGHTEIPECLLYADKLRLQQVFDNIFANSYKYADTAIEISVVKENGALFICIEDYGGGVSEAELLLLKEKYKRGSNAGGTEGAGLGLFIAALFMKEMEGGLLLENGRNGLRVTVRIALSLTCKKYLRNV